MKEMRGTYLQIRALWICLLSQRMQGEQKKKRGISELLQSQGYETSTYDT